MKYPEQENSWRQKTDQCFPVAMERKVWGFSFWDDENVLELDKGYGYITYVPNTTKLCTLKWLVL